MLEKSKRTILMATGPTVDKVIAAHTQKIHLSEATND
jgi:hypothetical protein